MNFFAPHLKFPKIILPILSVYLFGYYWNELPGFHDWIRLVNWTLSFSVEKPFLPVISSSIYFVYFSLLSSLLLLKDNKIFILINLINWILYSDNAFINVTPQEGFISIILLTALIRKDEKISLFWYHLLFTVCGVSLFDSSLHKIMSQDWQNGTALEYLSTSAISSPNNLFMIIPNSVITYLSAMIQCGSILLLIPSAKFRKLYLGMLTVFFVGILFMMPLWSIILGMLVYLLFLFLVIKENEPNE